MKHALAITLCVFIPAFLLFAEEVEKRQGLLEYYDALPDEPSEDEIKALYELMARTASENKPMEMVGEFLFSYTSIPTRLGLSELNAKDFGMRLYAHIMDEDIPDRKVYRPPFKSFVLQVCLLRLLCEQQDDKIDKFTRNVIISYMLQIHKNSLDNNKDNPFLRKHAQYLYDESRKIDDKYKPMEELHSIISAYLARITIEGETIIERFAAWRKWINAQPVTLLNAIVGYEWLRNSVKEEDLLKVKIDENFDITIYKVRRQDGGEMLFNGIDLQHILSDIVHDYALIQYNDPLENQYNKHSNLLSEQLVVCRTASLIWKLLFINPNAYELKRSVINRMLQNNPCKELPYMLQIMYAENYEFTKNVTSIHENKMSIRSMNVELVKRISGESGPAWFYGDYVPENNNEIVHIKQDFLFPHVQMVRTDGIYSVTNYYGLLRRYPLIYPVILGRTGHFLWNNDQHLCREYTPNKVYDIDRKVEFNFDVPHLAEILSTDLAQLLEGTTGVSSVSINPRTAMQVFSPCVRYYYEKTKYEIFSYAESFPHIERPVGIIVVSPADNVHPTKVEPYLIPQAASSYLWRTGIIPDLPTNWMKRTYFASPHGKEVVEICEKIVSELNETMPARFKKWAEDREKANCEAHGDPYIPKDPGPDNTEEVLKALGYNKRVEDFDEYKNAVRNLGSSPSDSEYDALLKFIRKKINATNYDQQKLHDIKRDRKSILKMNNFLQWAIKDARSSGAFQVECSISEGCLSASPESWRRYAISAALIESILESIGSLPIADFSKNNNMITLAYLISRTMLTTRADKYDTDRQTGWKWYERKIKELDAKYKFVGKYEKLVRDEYKALNISGNAIGDKIAEWRRKINTENSSIVLSALLVWAFKNIKDDMLIAENIPDGIPICDLKDPAHFVNRYGRLSELGCDDIIYNGTYVIGKYSDYFLASRVLQICMPNIQNGSDLPYRRRCFGHAAMHQEYSEFLYTLIHLTSDCSAKYEEYIEDYCKNYYECNYKDRIENRGVKYTKLCEHDGPDAWFASYEYPTEPSGKWEPEVVRVYPISLAIQDGKVLHYELLTPLRNEGLLKDFGPLSERRKQVPSITAKVDGLETDYNFTTERIEEMIVQGMGKKCLMNIDEDKLRIIVNKAIAEKVTILSDYALVVWYHFPRSRIVAYKESRSSGLENIEGRGTGRMVINIMPIEGDQPDEVVFGLVKKDGQQNLMKFGVSRMNETRPFHSAEVILWEEFQQILKQHQEAMKKDAEENRIFEQENSKSKRSLLLWGNAYGVPYDVD